MLLPIIAIYWLISTLHYYLMCPSKVKVPVICVGNITAGGSGKTPTVIALAQTLLAQNKKVAIITRGYGGSGRKHGPLEVTLNSDSSIVGDEALLLATIAPTYICNNRFIAAQAAYGHGAEIIIMDDGMQHYSLYKDFTLMVVDGQEQFGNGLLLPAGPMRESLKRGLSKADATLVIGGEPPSTLQNVPHVYKTAIKVSNSHEVLKRDFIAVCGIANPSKFFGTAQACGANLMETIMFPDHYNYPSKELEAIFERANSLQIKVLTTSKDAVKFPKHFLPHTQVLHISVILPISLVSQIQEKLNF